MPAAQLQAEYLHELRPEAFCRTLLEELRDACDAADNIDEAVFWQVQWNLSTSTTTLTL